MAEQDYSAYWRRHADVLQRIEQTAMFGAQFDYALAREDWRWCLALARYARMWMMPILEQRARRAAERFMPDVEKQAQDVLTWPGRLEVRDGGE
jgi:hypothetical protein